MTSTFTSSVLISEQTSIFGTTDVDLTADSGPVVSNASPNAHSIALGGSTSSVSTNTATYGSTITTQGGTAVPGNYIPVPDSSITAGNLNVTASTPAATLTTTDQLLGAAAGTGKASAKPIYTPENSVSFNSVATILGAGPRLHIGSAGQVIQQTGGVTFKKIGNTISVDPITSAATGTATFSTTWGRFEADHRVREFSISAPAISARGDPHQRLGHGLPDP